MEATWSTDPIPCADCLCVQTQARSWTGERASLSRQRRWFDRLLLAKAAPPPPPHPPKHPPPPPPSPKPPPPPPPPPTFTPCLGVSKPCVLPARPLLLLSCAPIHDSLILPLLAIPCSPSLLKTMSLLLVARICGLSLALLASCNACC